MRVFLGLCSNLGDRELNLVNARDLLAKHDVLVMGQSEVRETEPLGGLDQPMYLNQVVECQTELSPEELLAACKSVENEMGRPAKAMAVGNVSFGKKLEELPLAERWESRIIDVDILLYGDFVMKTPLLTIPHYELEKRWFLVEGLLDLDSRLDHPKSKRPLKEFRV